MAFLIDTHAFLWFVAGAKQLPESVKAKIFDINEACFLSVASLWEITIKNQIRKLTFNIISLFTWFHFRHYRQKTTTLKFLGDPFEVRLWVWKYFSHRTNYTRK
jgi:PIN domain nuclease of toxin-antitoxin system